MTNPGITLEFCERAAKRLRMAVDLAVTDDKTDPGLLRDCVVDTTQFFSDLADKAQDSAGAAVLRDAVGYAVTQLLWIGLRKM